MVASMFAFISSFLDALSPVFWLCGALSLITYLGMLFVQNLFDFILSDNLKTRYNASWAVVTGGSSGIGRAMVEKLAKQGVNVVIVSLDDELLAECHSDMQENYPDLEFRKVGVNLGSSDEKLYMEPIKAATKDIDVALLFNNAGFISTGFYSDVSLGRHLANHHCNGTAILPITHHFLEKMVSLKKKGKKGLIAFTSSSANLLPNPLSAIYSASKAFMTMFAVSIAAENRNQGIDTVVVHPSPIASNFFNSGTDLDALMAFKRFAQGPSVIADVVFSSAGRFVVRDQGPVTIGFRILLKFLDPNFFSEITSLFAHVSGDYKKHMSARRKQAMVNKGK